jgi:hypothetical protein
MASDVRLILLSFVIAAVYLRFDADVITIATAGSERVVSGGAHHAVHAPWTISLLAAPGHTSRDEMPIEPANHDIFSSGLNPALKAGLRGSVWSTTRVTSNLDSGESRTASGTGSHSFGGSGSLKSEPGEVRGSDLLAARSMLTSNMNATSDFPVASASVSSKVVTARPLLIQQAHVDAWASLDKIPFGR